MSIVEGDLTCVAFCWRLERTDGAGLALTSHDQSVDRDEATYVPSPGIVPAAVTRSLGLEPQSADVAGALSSDALDEADLSLGRWDGAKVRLLAIDWANPSESDVELLSGELGEISIHGESFSAELRGTAAKLEKNCCPSTSPQCRAHFGDNRCRVDLAGRSRRAVIVGNVNGELTLDQAFSDEFLLGRLRYLSGENCGRSTVIIGVEGNTVRVRDLPRGPIDASGVVELREGCDKRFQTCIERFGNAPNFRGEPHLPGADLLTRYPGA